MRGEGWRGMCHSVALAPGPSVGKQASGDGGWTTAPPAQLSEGVAQPPPAAGEP